MKTWITCWLLLSSPTSVALQKPLLTAKEPLDRRGSGSGIAEQDAMMNQWLAMDAALRVRKGLRVDFVEMNEYLKGCSGRLRNYGVVQLEFENGLSALIVAGEDGPFRMRRAGFNPRGVQLVMIGKTHVWCAQHGEIKPPPTSGGGGGGKLIRFPTISVREETERMMKAIRRTRGQA